MIRDTIKKKTEIIKNAKSGKRVFERNSGFSRVF